MTPTRSDELISTILFDADGVMQRTAAGWQLELVGLLGDRADAEGDAFLEAVREAEEPTMDGRTDITTAIAVVLKDFSVGAEVEDVLELWTRIQPHADMIDAVADLRRDRVRCCLTTNQQTRRAAWMRSHLGYDLVFDEEFYSCELGVAKPDPAYFSTVLESLDAKPATVLFVDDTEANVDAARTVGLNAEVFPRHGGRSALEEILRGYVVLGR